MIKLRLGGAHAVAVRLNGRPIASQFLLTPGRVPCGLAIKSRRTRGATCRLSASPNDGLRYGVNLLWVRFGTGAAARVRAVRFRVASARPLAAAGRDPSEFVPIDQRYLLDGRASLMAPGLRRSLARRGRRGALRYRWRVIRGPRGGQPENGDDGPGRFDPYGNVPGELAHANTARPSVELDREGVYTVRLTVTQPDGRTGTDDITLVAGGEGGANTGPPIDGQPLVHVNTMATVKGQQGVLIHTYYDHPLAPEDCPVPVSDDQGNACFYPDPGNGKEWVQLVVFDRSAIATGLHLLANKSISCPYANLNRQEHSFDVSAGGDVYYHNGNQCIKDLSDYVSGLDSGDLVIAVNQPGAETDKSVQPPVGVGATLGGKFVDSPFVKHNLGIGSTAWWDDTENGKTLPDVVRGTFSAIGVPGRPDGGVWKLSAPDAWGQGGLSADVAVNNRARYAPLQNFPEEDERLSPVIKVLTQQPQPWPAMSACQGAALSALGVAVSLGPDPRAQFYSKQDSFDWKATRDNIAAQRYDTVPDRSCPGGGTFTAADYDSAKTELAKEIGYLLQVKSYLAGLARPYQAARNGLWSTFGSVVEKVNNTTSNGTTAAVLGAATEVFSAALEVLPAFKSIEKAAHIVVASYKVALAIAENASDAGRAEDVFATKAADLGKELTDRMTNAETVILTRWRNIIAADYGKLQAVANCSQNPTGCPGWDWELSENRETQFELMLKLGLERDMYTTLVPVKYPQALLLELRTNKSDSAGVRALQDLSNWCAPLSPFTRETGVYTAPAGDYLYPIVLTTGDPGFGKWEAANKEVFTRMFGPLDPGGNFDTSGVGIDESQFFQTRYGVVPADPTPPPHTDARYRSSDDFARFGFCRWGTG